MFSFYLLLLLLLLQLLFHEEVIVFATFESLVAAFWHGVGGVFVVAWLHCQAVLGGLLELLIWWHSWGIVVTLLWLLGDYFGVFSGFFGSLEALDVWFYLARRCHGNCFFYWVHSGYLFRSFHYFFVLSFI